MSVSSIAIVRGFKQSEKAKKQAIFFYFFLVSQLKRKSKIQKKFNWVHTRSTCRLLTTLCVLQSWPPIVRSNLNASELITSILHVSERPKA